MRTSFVILILICVIYPTLGTLYECDRKSSCGCSSVNSVVTKIHGGEASVKNSWGWIVSLRILESDKNRHFCAATILEANYIVTAAHCVDNISTLLDISACAGSNKLSGHCRQKRFISKIFIHPAYNNMTYENDIAIIQMATPFDLKDRILSTICLPHAKEVSNHPLPGTNVVAIGWGATGPDELTSDHLQQVTLQILNGTSDSCSPLISDERIEMCATSAGKDACKGDSGGPLMHFTAGKRWELVGITSYGDPRCAPPIRPGVYTRVSSYFDFITETVQKKDTESNDKSHACKCQCPYGNNAGSAITLNNTAESCVVACVKEPSNSCQLKNTYACLHSQCVYSSSYEHSPVIVNHDPKVHYCKETFSNGDRYDGQCLNGRNHGQGTYYYASGSKYVGDWVNGTRAGYGIMTWSQGEKYVGHWINNDRHGKGTMTWANSHQYTGYWVDDIRTGNGVYIWSNGDKYDGAFKHNNLQGQGTYYYANGDKYVGDWVNNTRTGHGAITSANGKQYVGEWMNDNMHGNGIITWPDGDTYEGQHKDGKQHGRGTYHSAQGDKYVGDWVNGNMTGHGIMIWSDGDKYIGDWLNDSRTGHGLMIWSNGDKYVGDWIIDTRTGQGIMTRSNGEKYVGEWEDDSRVGDGLFTSADGDRFEGQFDNDRFHGRGKMLYLNGATLEGTWYHGDLMD